MVAHPDIANRVSVYHNILWSKYKGAVFSEMHAQSESRGIAISFVQIAETEGRRVGLGSVDLSYHAYPYRLLFRGSGDQRFWAKRVWTVVWDLVKYPSDLVILPGYEKIEYWAMLAVCILMRRRRAVFCDSTIHDNPQRRIRGYAKRFFFSRCDAYFCYGSRSREYLLSYGAKDSKIIYRCQAAALPHGYSQLAVVRDYEAAIKEGPAPRRFLYLGRLSYEKGLPDLIHAFAIAKRAIPDAILDIVGAGDIAAELESLVGSLGLTQHVNFHGAKDVGDIAKLMVRSTALVLPSHSEPWGLVVNEALSYGCPVIVSSICGCVPELVIDGVTGYSFPVGDVQALATAMLRVTEDFVDKLAVARRCFEVIQRHTAENAAAQILDGCAAILSGRASAQPT